MRYRRLLTIGAVTIAISAAASLCRAAEPGVTAGKPKKQAAPGFQPPYPERANPFQLPDSKAALATRREAVVQHVDLQLKGFVKVGGVQRAVVALDGQVAMLELGDRRGDIQVLEVAPPTLTLQRGRHRWTESLRNEQVARGELSRQ